MASFIIHTIVGEHLLTKLEKTFNTTISNYNKKQFLLGNLIVDSIKTDKTIPSTINKNQITEYKMQIKTKIRKEKLTTHFRNPAKEGECLKVPRPELFLKKYNHLIKENFSVLGYLFHLYTDKLFFSKLFAETFDNIDADGNLVTEDKNLIYIRIIKNNIIVDAKDFWSGTSNINIYNDYTIMNKLLLEHFGTSFNQDEFNTFAQEYFVNPGIEEVSFNNITQIINDTHYFIEESYNMKEQELSVFTEEQIIKFVDYVVEQFMKEYKTIINNIFDIKK